MKALVLALTTASLLAGPVLAQDTTVIRREGIAGDTTVVKHRDIDGDTVHKKVVTTGSTGCRTKTVKKTNDMGDSVTRTKSDC
jgi:hypothetical protein